MTRVALICGDVVARRMAGPAIRTIELARVLAAAGHEVTVAAPPGGEALELARVAIVTHADDAMAHLAATADVVIGQGWPLERWPALRRGPGCLVVDLYDPYPLEGLVLDAGEPLPEREHRHRGRMTTLTHQLDDGDLFLCAGGRQRDLWLGALTARGRVNPRTYTGDPGLRRLVDVVPFGLPAAPPQPRRQAVRDTFPEIAGGDLVLLWGGGIYDWFDPLTLVRAVGLAAERVPRLRLVLHAAPHPSPAVAPMSMVERTRALAGELGLTGRHVFFNERWVAYEERADWLCDADVGVSTHLPHVETEYAFRTRMLDYLWAGLPILCTAGDVLAVEVERRGLGITVPPDDPERLADAIVRLDDPALRATCRERAAAMAATLTWEAVAEPLLRFCAEPRRAADRVDRGIEREATDPPPAPISGVARTLRRLARPAVRRVRRLRGGG